MGTVAGRIATGSTRGPFAKMSAKATGFPASTRIAHSFIKLEPVRRACQSLASLLDCAAQGTVEFACCVTGHLVH
jgi:hypothetical protein